MTEHDYLTLVRSRDLDGLQDAWDRAVESPGDVAVYCQTLTELCDRNQHGTALDLGTRMVDTLEKRDRLDDALQLAITLIRKDAHNESFVRNTMQIVRKRCGSEPWFEVVSELSGLAAEKPTADAFALFERARRMTPGNVVNHRAGWGEGIVRELDPHGRTLRVEFADGAEREFPLAKAVDTLRPLAPDDIRAMRLLDPAGLDRIAQDDPSRLIRMAASVFRGSISSTQLKGEVCPSVVPQKSWNAWWKRAKTAASHDPWLEVTGTKQRPLFELRKQPLSLAEEAEKRLGHCHDIPEVIAVTREYLARGLHEHGEATFLDLAQARIDAAVAASSDTPAHLLDGIVFLEEHGRSTSVSAAEELRRLVVDHTGEFHPERIAQLATAESRAHAIQLLPDALGAGWEEQCLAKITSVPAEEAELVVERLQEAKVADRLAPTWAQVAPFPRKHPTVTYLLAKLYADGVFDGREDAPDLVGVARVVMHLARIIAKERKGEPALNRIRSRVTSLLVGRRSLLGRALESGARADVAAFLGIAERGGQEFPQEVTDAILRVVADRFPDLTKKPERPFWENDGVIYVTTAGFARHKEAHRVLVDEKIPLNAKAIHAAASYGDLSENAEWEAAMEEQRNLTGRAEEMSRELKRARLLEDQKIPEGMVAPGTRVRFTYVDTGETGALRILGPWDCIEEDIVNYRAPLAHALLGTRPGEESSIVVPEGERTIRVDHVERIV
ncbi:MAG: GreA/GreB family elongation factor [Planctomycetes bacterium]|nr:GreA/GreB family elongation factor [Planctomycetota bacterium]